MALRHNLKLAPLPPLRPMDWEGNIQPKPEAVLDRRMKQVDDHPMTDVLIRWNRTFTKDSLWESLWKLHDL